MGDPDLTGAPSLAATIRLGDVDAVAGFRDAHAEKVRSFCASVCAPERLDDACEAAFIEFVARIRTTEIGDERLDDLLLKATRSAAAGRCQIIRPRPSRDGAQASHPDPRICAAMPELLAAAANSELRGDPAALAREQESCPTCAATAARMRTAERAFALAPGPGAG